MRLLKNEFFSDSSQRLHQAAEITT